MQNVYFTMPFNPTSTEKRLKYEYRREAGRAGGLLLVAELLMLVFNIAAMFAPMFMYELAQELISTLGPDTPGFLFWLSNVLEPISDTDSTSLLLIATIAGSMFGLTIPAMVYAHKRRIDIFELFRGGKFTPGFVLGAACFGISLNCLWGFAYTWLCERWPLLEMNMEDSALDFPTDSVLEIVLYILAVCVAAPIFEELIFRGVLLKFLCRYGTTFAILVTSLYFGLFHGNLAQTPATFLLALVMGYSAVKTGSLVCPILIHFINNSVATVMSALYAFFPDAAWVSVIDIAVYVLLLAGSIIFLVCRPGRLPKQSKMPSVPTVKHRYYHFFTSGLNILFILLFIAAIIMNFNFEAIGIELI